MENQISSDTADSTKKKNEVTCNTAASHLRVVNRFHYYIQNLFFFNQHFTKPKHIFIEFTSTQQDPFLKEWKSIKKYQMFIFLRNNLTVSFSRSKIPLSFQNVDFQCTGWRFLHLKWIICYCIACFSITPSFWFETLFQ